MNKYPGDRSVLLMDNCNIHASSYLRAVVEAKGTDNIDPWFGSDLLLIFGLGCMLLFLPAYSPDFQPIEESFSSCELCYSNLRVHC